jgi:hypothetical protein
VALKNTMVPNLNTEDRRGLVIDLSNAAHFRVESLVANVSGRGIGTMLVGRAIESVPERLTELGMAGLSQVLITAIAAQSSQRVFSNAGFSSYEQLGVVPDLLPADYELSSGKQFMIQAIAALQLV